MYVSIVKPHVRFMMCDENDIFLQMQSILWNYTDLP